MVKKLKERKAALEAKEAALKAEIASLQAKRKVIDEMIAEEESLVTPVVSEEVVTETEVVETATENESENFITIRI